MLYLRGQGYARGGAEKLGPDIVQFLEDNGHTFMGNARRQLENMSTSQWSNMQRDLWVAGNPQVEALFGLNPYELESLYMSHLNPSILKHPELSPVIKLLGQPESAEPKVEQDSLNHPMRLMVIMAQAGIISIY